VNNVLLQTTIPYTKDDWSIARFSMLAEILSSVKDSSGQPRFRVTARDRENLSNGDDRILAKLDESDFDQLWLFGVDVGNGLTSGDCAAITRFHQRRGGIMTTRDHQDLGISFCTLGGIGDANHFHSKNPELDISRHKIDDTESPDITWPNYHSGANGDFQRVQATNPLHPVMKNKNNRSGRIETLPAHPHEGAVSVPRRESNRARVIATGKSKLTGTPFNIAIAFEANGKGRALVDSSFHHFLDYNLDPSKGCPSFVSEPPGHAIVENPEAAEDARAYARNIALWLAS
jgi:hypothetical protein